MARPRPTSSPWSDEGRAFFQERLARFARVVFLASTPFFFAGWIVDLVWYPVVLQNGLPVRITHLLNLAWMAGLLTMWLATRGAPLPAAVLHALDGGGMFFVCAASIGMAFSIPVSLRPDLLAVITLLAMLLYRAAIVPSETRRTAWIGVFCVAPLPFFTHYAYTHGTRPAGMPSAWAYVVYSILFAILIVLLSSKTSSVIYGLRQTVREARQLGPYTLTAKIGEGGMGAVYRAEHALLRRPTAVKILPPERAGEMDLARFEREVQMTSQLTSPHTVSVYDFGRTPDGLFYYAMEFLDGIDLQELVSRDGPMLPGRVVHVLRQVCEALGEAHRAGLIHRDIKPANILLSVRGGRRDVATVVDFGLVKDVAATAGPGVTLENIVLGTPHYLAPEALRTPDRIDARSDLYALGATAYFLLTGQPVFDGPVTEIFAHHLGTMPTPVSARLGRPISAELERLVLRALSKSPEDRPESAEAFDAALAACSDVPPWTEAEAAAWWRTSGNRLLAARSGKIEAAVAARPATLTIARRVAG